MYVPHVRVFAKRNLKLLKRQNGFNVACVAAAPPNKPNINSEGEYADSRWRTYVRSQIRTMFALAHEHKHDALVLGAWGCGAYHNPPQEIAKAFCAEMLNNHYTGEVVFSTHRHPQFRAAVEHELSA